MEIITTRKTTDLKRAARKYCIDRGLYTYGGRGRTDGPTYVCWNTWVSIIPDSDIAPNVKGLGYWKTNFSTGSFSKTLYTPSTFRIEVGANWQPTQHKF